MGCGKRRKLIAMGLSNSSAMVFLLLKDEADCNEDLRVMASREWIAEQTGYSDKVVRTALRQLEDHALVLSTRTTRKRAAIYSFPQAADRREGQPKGQPKGQQETPTIKHELIDKGQPKGQPKGQTGVTAVSRCSGVDVSPALSVSVRATTARATPSVDNSQKKPPAPPRRRRQEDYDAAIARAPQLGEVWMYLDQLSADMTGHKYPWSQHPYAATILADLLCAYGQPVVLAAAEKFFQRGDPWIERRGWAIEEFGKLFAGLLAKDGIMKRAAKIEADLKLSARPTSPKELRAQLETMRRRNLDALAGIADPDTRRELSVA